MYKLKLKFLVGLLSLSLVACTVKESRDGSPCWLYEEVSRMPSSQVTVWLNSAVLTTSPTSKEREMEFEIPRGLVNVTAVNLTPNVSYDAVAGTYLHLTDVPLDSIYSYRNAVDCTNEYSRDTLVPRKQFATFTLKFDITPGHELYPDSLLLQSQWCGENVLTLDPVAGTYECDFPCDSTAISFRVPRQGDNTLKIVLYQKWGKVTDVIPIGQVLSENKYDWKAEELADVDMTMVQAAIGLQLVVVKWKDIDNPIIIDL